MNPLKRFSIAIDGPGGAGKSTVAGQVAAALGVLHLDTGAMYRAFAYQAIREGVRMDDEPALAALADRVRIDVRFEGGRQRTSVNGEDVTDRIRTPETSMAASDCATHGEVRRRMVALQREIAGRQSMVLDGRDIGTRVLPGATLKIYLTASSEVRARRRHAELAARGVETDFETVLAEVIARDRQDSTRSVDPLTVAPDAVTLDTSAMDRDEVVRTILSLLEKKLMQTSQTETAAPVQEKFSFFYRVAMWLSAFVFHVVFPIRYHHVENAALDAPFILIGNHNSMVDPFLIGWKISRYQLRFLGKKELIKHPLTRAVYRNMRMIPVDRHNMDMAAVRACLKALKENHALGIFPEGTRHKRTLMEEMESGVAVIALRGNVPILPAYIADKPRLFRPIDCYYGKPFSVAGYAEKGVNREATEQVLWHITALYREMAREHLSHKTRGR